MATPTNNHTTSTTNPGIGSLNNSTSNNSTNISNNKNTQSPMEQCATTGDCEVLWQAYVQEYKHLVASASSTSAQVTEDSTATTAQEWEEKVKARFHSAVQMVQQHEQDAEATYQVELNHMIHRLPLPNKTGSNEDDDDTSDNKNKNNNNNTVDDYDVDDDDDVNATIVDSSSSPSSRRRHLLGAHNNNNNNNNNLLTSSHSKTSKSHSSTATITIDNVAPPTLFKIKRKNMFLDEPFGGAISFPPQILGTEVTFHMKHSVLEPFQTTTTTTTTTTTASSTTTSSSTSLVEDGNDEDEDDDDTVDGNDDDDNVAVNGGNATTTAASATTTTTTSTVPPVEVDPFKEHLNWATKHNPDEVSLVHNTGFDQGSCGSCWAYAATGSLEASVARQTALDAYHWALDWLQQNYSSHYVELTHRRRWAKEYARKVEELVFSSTSLSVQELIDCDTRADQGCIGGNPLLAYFYIYRHGLVSWDDYIYEEGQDACPWRPTGKTNTRGAKSAVAEERIPVATAGSWGILPKNYEDTIAFALRHIGPVSVGIHGDDPQFLLYKGGIFNKASCPQDANHAVLLVGYGQEEMYTPNGKEMVRYWIARNSWGNTWGENGFIRIKRGSGEKKVAGICGLARSPSVALAGRLLTDYELPPLTVDSEPDLVGPTPTVSTLQNSGSNAMDISAAIGATDNEYYNVYYKSARDELDSIERMSKTTLFCDSLVPSGGVHIRHACYSLVNLVDAHWVTSLGVIGILAAISVSLPLFNCCRRKRRRRPKGQESPNKSPYSSNASSTATLNLPENPPAPMNESTPLLR